MNNKQLRIQTIKIQFRNQMIKNLLRNPMIKNHYRNRMIKKQFRNQMIRTNLNPHNRIQIKMNLKRNKFRRAKTKINR